MPKPLVSIIIPVVRPELVKRLLLSIKLDYSLCPDSYEIITEVDFDRIGCPMMVKKLTEKTNSDLVAFLGEDCIVKAEFLNKALEEMKKFKDGWGLVVFDEQGGRVNKDKKIASHWLASKKLLEYLDGEFFYTGGYTHTYCDVELADRCRELGRFSVVNDVIIHKPVKDGIYDEVHSTENIIFDRKLYLYRKEHNWNSELKFTGEKIIPEFMRKHVGIYSEHIARYNFILQCIVGKKVLDASCGCGWATNLMYDIASEVRGIDNDITALVYARRNYRGNFSLCNLNKDFPNEDFDTVISMETIEHLKNHDVFFDNIKKHAKEFIFSIPIGNNNKFHEKVFNSFDDVVFFMGNYFKNIRWHTQNRTNIIKSNTQNINKHKYVIGHVKKI